jgi:hypothetical protein
MANIKDEKIFLIYCRELGQTTIPVVHDMVQIHCVYIFCQHKVRHEEWLKVQGVYIDITSICKVLNQTAQECDHNSVSMSFVQTIDGASNENLDQLDQSFMYTQILKEILLTINFQQEHIDELLTYCREQYVGNSAELKNVNKIEKEY